MVKNSGANYQRLVELAVQEATKLRELTTESEKAKLYPNSIWAKSRTSCIYGQISGHCFSDRAHELMKICAPRVYERPDNKNLVDCRLTPTTKSVRRAIESRDDIATRTRYWSPIEVLITMWDDPFGPNFNSDNMVNLAKYIKGEIAEFVLE